MQFTKVLTPFACVFNQFANGSFANIVGKFSLIRSLNVQLVSTYSVYKSIFFFVQINLCVTLTKLEKFFILVKMEIFHEFSKQREMEI